MLVSILLFHPGDSILPPTQELVSVSFWHLLKNANISQVHEKSESLYDGVCLRLWFGLSAQNSLLL
jgi:hypothetical protein